MCLSLQVPQIFYFAGNSTNRIRTYSAFSRQIKGHAKACKETLSNLFVYRGYATLHARVCIYIKCIYNWRCAYCVCNKISQTTKQSMLKVAKKAFFPCTSLHFSVWIFANRLFITPAKIQIIVKIRKPFAKKASFFIQYLHNLHTHNHKMKIISSPFLP